MTITNVEFDLPPEQQPELIRIANILTYYQHLKLGNNEPDFELLSKSLANASYKENVRIFGGPNRYSTISEINQYKLFLFIENVLDGFIPSENEVAQIFKLTPSAASTLLKNVQSRYQLELHEATNLTVQRIITNEDNLGEEKIIRIDGADVMYREIYIRSKNIVKLINEQLQFSERSYRPIILVKGSNNLYTLFDETRDKIIEIFV